MKVFALPILLLFFSTQMSCINSSNNIKEETISNSKNIELDPVQSQDDFVKFFDRFKSALKSNNKAAVCSLISFPIHNLRPFYLPDFSKTEATDTAGLSRKEFLRLYDKVFDDETSWITDVTVDSLYEYTDSTDELGLTLQKNVDKNTPVYDYPVIYDHGNNGGVKNLYFGQIKGKYKLFWIACSGNVRSRKND